jgi:hypothetical protein
VPCTLCRRFAAPFLTAHLLAMAKSDEQLAGSPGTTPDPHDGRQRKARSNNHDTGMRVLRFAREAGDQRPMHRCRATLPNPLAPFPRSTGQLPVPPHSSRFRDPCYIGTPRTLRHWFVPSPCPPFLPFQLPSLGTRSGLIPTPCVCAVLLSLRVLRMPVPPTFSAPTTRLFALRKKAGTQPEKARLALGVATSRS